MDIIDMKSQIIQKKGMNADTTFPTGRGKIMSASVPVLHNTLMTYDTAI